MESRAKSNVRTILLMVLLLAVSTTVASGASASVEKDTVSHDCDGEGDLFVGTVDSDERNANVPSPSQPFDKRALKRRRVRASTLAVKGARVPKAYGGTAAANLRLRPSAMGTIGIDIPEGSTAEEVISELGLDQWEALKTSQWVEMPGEVWELADGTTVPALKKLDTRWNTTVHSQTLQPFGNVGKDYNILPHPVAIRTLWDVADSLHLECEYAHVGKGGAELIAAFIVPDEVIEFNNGQERIQQYLAVRNTHDGKGAFTVSQYGMRLDCWNQYVAVTRAAAEGNARSNIEYTMRASIRHSDRMNDAIAEFSDIMARQSQHHREYANTAELLIESPMSDLEMRNYWVSCGDLECHPDRVTLDNPWGLSTKGLNILETLDNLRLQDQNQVGNMDGTKWQGLQVWLDYYDHEKNWDADGEIKPTSVIQCLHGTGVQAKIAAQKKAIRMLSIAEERGTPDYDLAMGQICSFKVAGSRARATQSGREGLLVATTAAPARAREVGENEQVFEG